MKTKRNSKLYQEEIFGIVSKERPKAKKELYFGANLLGIDGRCNFAPLQNQRIFRQIRRFAAKVFHFVLIPFSKIIKSQTVFFLIHNGQQLCLESFALSCVQQTLKHRVLYPLSIIDALPSNLAQAFSSSSVFGIDIVRN